MLLIGRAVERGRLEANVATGRHTLLAGPLGIGKSHLLRAVAPAWQQAVYLDHIRPLHGSLLALAQSLHGQGALRLPAGNPGPDWPECAKQLGRLTIQELTDVVAASLRARPTVLILDHLDQATPSMLPALERFLAEAVVLGATRQCKPRLEKLWWAFDRIDLLPMSGDETRALLWTLVAREQISDPDMFEAKVVAQANGNPYAVVEMVKQVAGPGEVSRQTIRDLHHGAGVRYLDLAPVLLFVGAGLVAARFVALGLDDPDLYILAGSLGAMFFAARYLLFRSHPK